MKKSACIETMFTEVPFNERFRLAKESGFDYVEFWSWKDKNLDEIKELSQKHQLKIASFSGDKDFSLIDEKESEAYIKFVMESVEAAKYLDCQYLVIHSNALGEGGKVINSYDEISDSKKFDAALSTLRSLAPLVEKERVVLVLEALNTVVDHVGNYLAHTRDSAEFIRRVNSPCIKALYDAYHMQITEGNIIDTIRRHVKEIGYIHVADVPGRQEPGTGEINYKNVMDALRELEYDGFIGFELFPSKSSAEASEIIMKL